MTGRIVVATFAAFLLLAVSPVLAQTETKPAAKPAMTASATAPAGANTNMPAGANTNTAAGANENAPAADTPAAADADEGVIGTMVEVEGTATVTPAGGEPVAAAIDGPLHMNDEVRTAAGAKVFILFIDNTQMTLSENTKMKIDDYVFDPDNNKDNRARYSVLDGAFQYVSGLIGHKDNPDVKVETPVGSIGIRGTDFWAGNLDNQYNVAVNEGQVGLKTQGGESLVNKGEGTSVLDRRHAPAPAHAWSPEQFQRAAGTVHLARRDWVRQRIKEIQPRHEAMRGRYKNFMQQHRRGGRWDRSVRSGRAFGHGERGLGHDNRGFGNSDRGSRRGEHGFNRGEHGPGRGERGFGRGENRGGREGGLFGNRGGGQGREKPGFGGRTGGGKTSTGRIGGGFGDFMKNMSNARGGKTGRGGGFSRGGHGGGLNKKKDAKP